MALPDYTKFRAYWNLSETSGNAIDATGNGNTLTDTNTVGSADGGRDFEASNSEYFVRDSTTSLSTGDIDWTLGVWFKPESVGICQCLLSKDDSSTGREYRLSILDTNKVAMYWFSPSGDTEINSTVTLSAGTRYFILGWHDAVNNKVCCQINNGSVYEANTSGHTHSASTHKFSMGALMEINSWFADGIMWSAFAYAGVMTSDERTAMYNSGTPLKWADIRGGPPGVKTINGIDIAKVKTINGVDTAKVKSIWGIQ